MIRSLLLGALASAALSSPAPAQDFDPDQWGALSWREVGPYRGGRSAAVAGIPQAQHAHRCTRRSESANGTATAQARAT